MNLAIDSRPLKSHISETLDYSGIQFYSLSDRPLHTFIQNLQSKEDARIWTVKLNEHSWFSGEKIKAEYYVEGLKQILFSQSRLRSYLVPKIHKLSCTIDQITIEFNSKFLSADSLFKMPNWVPIRRGFNSGNYQIHESNDSSKWILLDRNGNQGQLFLVDSPEMNEKLYQENRLDFTADTAIHLESVTSDTRRIDTGLNGLLVYSTLLSQSQVADLNYDLIDIRFDPVMESVYSRVPIHSDKKASYECTDRTLTLAYDDFYPNLLICSKIADHLRNKNWNVNLIKDNYYRPQINADLKFMILRSQVRTDFFRAFLLGGLPRAKFHSQEIHAAINRVANGGQYNSCWIQDLGLGFPLFTIPSLYKTRQLGENPLLGAFV